MQLNWSSKMIKYALFVFNLLFVITGIVIIAVGVSVKAYFNDYVSFLDDNYFSLPNLLIATGSLIFFISFFGCCGAAKESYCMIFSFSALLILIFILEFAAGIAGYVLRNDTASYLESKLNKTIFEYGRKDYDGITELWDEVQHSFHCCGIRNATDWVNVPDLPNRPQPDSLPMSCCVSKSGIIGNMTCSVDGNNKTSTYWPRGCEAAFGDYIREHAITIGGVGITIAFLQLFGIAFACHLARQIRYAYIST